MAKETKNNGFDDAAKDVVKKQQSDNITNLHGDKEDEAPKRLIGKDFDGNMMSLLKKGRDDLDAIKEERAALSTKKAAIIANWSAKGLSPDAIQDAAKYCEKSEKDKLNYDISYSYAREVFGEPVQVDMFEESMKAEIREKQSQ